MVYAYCMQTVVCVSLCVFLHAICVIPVCPHPHARLSVCRLSGRIKGSALIPLARGEWLDSQAYLSVGVDDICPHGHSLTLKASEQVTNHHGS